MQKPHTHAQRAFYHSLFPVPQKGKDFFDTNRCHPKRIYADIKASYPSGTVRQIIFWRIVLVSVEMETSTIHTIPA